MATKAPAQIADSLPDPNWGASQFTDWYKANKGKYIYDNQGVLTQLPSYVVTAENVKQIQGLFSSPQSTFSGASLHPLGATATGAAGTSAASPAASPGASNSFSFGAAPTTTSFGGAPTYYGGAGAAGAGAAGVGGASIGGSNMTWNQVGTSIGLSQADINSFQQQGFTPDQVAQSFQTTGRPPQPAAPQQNAFGISQVGSGPGYTLLSNTQGQQLAVDNAGNYFTIDPSTGNHTPVSDTQAVGMGFQSANPETSALKQMGQIDPASEALRTAVAQSYLTPLQQAGAPTLNTSATPSAGDLQSYLDLFKQVAPEEYAQRAKLATSMDSYLKGVQAQAALGSQLDPVTARQVEQQTRLGQAARGNVYGTPQMVEEAMTTGEAGIALQQQRQQNLGTALGAQQSYLGSGLGLGDTALGLYNTGFSQNMQKYQQQLAALNQAQGGALSYLGSGQTPYQAGASYLNAANANAAGAAQGGPVYNPVNLGQSYTGTSQQAPQYGLDVGQQSQNWYNSLAAYGQTAPQTNKAMSAGAGALGGAASGALAGSAAGPYGTLIGAGIGAIGGAAKGYFS